MSTKQAEGKVNLVFKTELYPYKKNMKKFEKDYNFTYGDGKKSTPRFCMYNDKPHIYLNEFIISSLAKTKKEKGVLINYVKKNFDKGWDESPDSQAEEELDSVD